MTLSEIKTLIKKRYELGNISSAQIWFKAYRRKGGKLTYNQIVKCVK